MAAPSQPPRRQLVSVLKNAPPPIAYATAKVEVHTHDDDPEYPSALSALGRRLVGRNIDKTDQTRKRPSEGERDQTRDEVDEADETDQVVVYGANDQVHDGDLDDLETLPHPKPVKIKKVRFLLTARRRNNALPLVPFNPVPPPPLPFNPEPPPPVRFNPNPPPPPPPPDLPSGFFHGVPETELPNGLPPPPSPPQVIAEPVVHPPLPPSVFETLPDPPPHPPPDILQPFPPNPKFQLPPPPPPPETGIPFQTLPQLPLPIFTSTSSGDTYVSRAAFKLYQKFVVSVSDFVDMQGNVTRKRVEVQERRTLCRLQRAYIHQCDLALYEHLRSIPANKRNKKDPKFAELFDESQKARDDAIPLEDHYEAIEVELGAAEYALKEKFGPLIYRFENLFNLNAATSAAAVPTPTSNFSFISSDRSSDQLSDQGLIRVGGEAGDGLKVGQIPTSLRIRQHGTHTRDQTSSPRRPPRLRRSDGGSEPIVFPSLQISSVDALAPRTLKSKSGRGRGETIEDNIVGVGEHENIRDWRRSERSTETPGSLKRKVSSLDGEASRTSTLETGQAREQQVSESLIGIGDFSSPDVLGGEEGPEPTTALDDPPEWPFQEGPHRYFAHISQQAGDDETILLRGEDGETQSTLSDYLMVFDSTRERVNKWLLHKLRVSPLEVFELQGRVRAANENIPDWERRALSMWDRDGYELGMSYDDGSVDETENTKEFSIPPPYPTVDHRPRHRRKRSDRRLAEGNQLLPRGTAMSLDKSQVDLTSIDLIGL